MNVIIQVEGLRIAKTYTHALSLAEVWQNIDAGGGVELNDGQRVFWVPKAHISLVERAAG